MDASVFKPASERQARLLALADFIERRAYAFDMGRWEACIAGNCARMIGVERPSREAVAMEYLSLTSKEALTLFAPNGNELGIEQVHGGYITRAWAVATLRYLAFTGRVDWKAARPAAGSLSPADLDSRGRRRVRLYNVTDYSRAAMDDPVVVHEFMPLGELVPYFERRSQVYEHTL